MKNPRLNWVRLPIDNLENCRELGGYNTASGEQTKWHAFLRSSEMSKLASEDIAFLEAYGVRTVIDLRRGDEIEKHPNPLAEAGFCRYRNIPLFSDRTADHSALMAGEITLGEVYVDWLENGSSAIRLIFEAIGNAEEGAVVFHCQAGKDRTGVVAMLLLGLAGVEEKDIVSNYEVTYTNLQAMIGQYSHQYGKDVLYSKREYILRAYAHIIDRYGSVERYLLAIGVSEDVLGRVRSKLIEENETVMLSV